MPGYNNLASVDSGLGRIGTRASILASTPEVKHVYSISLIQKHVPDSRSGLACERVQSRDPMGLPERSIKCFRTSGNHHRRRAVSGSRRQTLGIIRLLDYSA